MTLDEFMAMVPPGDVVTVTCGPARALSPSAARKQASCQVLEVQAKCQPENPGET